MTVGLTTILDPAGVQNQGLKAVTKSQTEEYFQDIHQENILRVNLIEIIVLQDRRPQVSRKYIDLQNERRNI